MTPFEIIVKPEAEADITEAAIWYEGRRVGLGNDFLLAIEAKLEGIKRNPNQFPDLYKTVKRALLSRFPYAIYFIREGSNIFILAVIHEKRKPTYHEERVE